MAEMWMSRLRTGLSCALLSGCADQSLCTAGAGWGGEGRGFVTLDSATLQRSGECFSGRDAACSAPCSTSCRQAGATAGFVMVWFVSRIFVWF